MKKRRIKIRWSCGRVSGHAHRWKWSAEFCASLARLRPFRYRWFLYGDEKLTAIGTPFCWFTWSEGGRDFNRNELWWGWRFAWGWPPPDGENFAHEVERVRRRIPGPARFTVGKNFAYRIVAK